MHGLRLSTKEINTILHDLEAEAQDHHPQRRSRRVPLRKCYIVVYRGLEEQPIGVIRRNFFRHGVGFLFGQYTTPDERIRIALFNKAKKDWPEKS